MAKLVSPKAELAVLRGMCSKNKALAGSLIAQTDETYFYHDESKELYKAIRKHVIKVGHPPSYQTVLEDLRISEEARDHFKLSRRSIRTVEDVDAAVTVLNRYRQTRGILEIADYINTKLKKSSIDADLMLSDITEALTSVKTKKSMEDTIVHFGRNNSSRELVKEIIYGDNTENVIPTGLRTFDERNGGFLRGSLVTIGGNSGAGKTLVANAICMNMSVLGYSVLYVPLEMSKREMTARMLARISGVDLLKILLNKLTDREKELVNRRYRKFIRTVRNAGGRYTVFRPKEDMTLEEIYSAAAAYQCDVKCVDYLTLLKGMDGDDQWRQLGNATRYSKIDAENSNSVNMVLAQVSDEGKIRYSGAVREHCVTGDTLIDTDKGLVRIDSLYADAKIASTKTLHGINVKSEGVYRPASHVHYNGVRPVYEVVLSNGMTIRSTSQHRYRFLNKNLKVSWERLENLRVGDTIAIDNTKGKFGNSPTTGNLEYKDILDIKNTLLGSYREGFIDDLVSYSHNRFVEIESITKVGEEKVYDLTVPETENYVANGIVVHNSSNGWTFTANQETKEQGILKISQIKSRNQDHFPFTLKVDYPTMDVRDLPPDEVIETSPGKKSSDRTPPNLAPDV